MVKIASKTDFKGKTPPDQVGSKAEPADQDSALGNAHPVEHAGLQLALKDPAGQTVQTKLWKYL